MSWCKHWNQYWTF